MEPKLESGKRSALKVPWVDVEAVPIYSADNDEESFYPRRGKSKIQPDPTIRTVGPRQVCVVPGNRPGPERARGTPFGPYDDRVVPARKGPGPAVENQSLGIVRPSAAVEAPCVAVSNRQVPPSDSDGFDDRRPIRRSPSRYH